MWCTVQLTEQHDSVLYNGMLLWDPYTYIGSDDKNEMWAKVSLIILFLDSSDLFGALEKQEF